MYTVCSIEYYRQYTTDEGEETGIILLYTSNIEYYSIEYYGHIEYYRQYTKPSIVAEFRVLRNLVPPYGKG